MTKATTRDEVMALVEGARASPDLHDQRLAAVARILTGRDVDHDWAGGFALDAGARRPASPVDGRGMGSWTKLVVAQPRSGERFLTFPNRSDVGHLYHEGRDSDARQVLPFATRSFLVFPRHPADGGEALGTWVDLADALPPGGESVVLYPARDMEGRGFSPYAVSNADFARGNAAAAGYASWLAFPRHPDDDAEELLRLSIIESDGHRQANHHGGFCQALGVVGEALAAAGHAGAAAYVADRYRGYVGDGMVEEEGWFSTGFATLAIVRETDGPAVVRQVACVEGGEAVLRHVPAKGREGEDDLVRRMPGERRPLSACFAYDRALLGRLEGGEGTWGARWAAEADSGALVGLTERAASSDPARTPDGA